MCRDIIDNGVSTEGEKVRPKWEDGTYAYTMKKFCVVNRYDLSKEFPALTLRRTGIKSCVDELLWIWQRKSNNIHDLKPRIWDSWADEEGSIGKAYGYQMGVKHEYKEGMMDHTPLSFCLWCYISPTVTRRKRTDTSWWLCLRLAVSFSTSSITLIV